MTWKENLIKYRRERAAGTLEDARTMFERKRWLSTVNRIYYALFYEVIALLQTRDLSAHKHTGVRALFNQHFIKTGIVNVDIGKFFNKMFDFRQKGDYQDFIYFEEEDVNDWMEKAEKYINELEKHFDKEMAEPGQPAG